MDADLSLAGASHFYPVVPMNASDEPMGSANRTDAFVFGLCPAAASDGHCEGAQSRSHLFA